MPARVRKPTNELTILLPARNEAASIRKVIEEVKENLPNASILVADSSTDGTDRIARRWGARVIKVPKGKGAGVQEAISCIDTPYVIMMNSDYTYPAGYARLVSRLLMNGEPKPDVIVGSRELLEKDSMSRVHMMGNWCLSLLASILYGKRIYDVCTGMWGFRTEVLRGFKLRSVGFTLEADLFINTVKGRWKLVGVPIAYRSRLEGSRAHLGWIDGLKIGWFLIRRRFCFT